MVLDPFMGSGQTAMAALNANRHYVGYEVEAAYVNLANKRLKPDAGCLPNTKIPRII